MIRTPSILAALTVVALPMTATAQTPPAPTGPTAIARLPNTFDGPATTRTAAQVPGQAQAQPSRPAEPTAADRARAETAEAMLKTTIAAIQAGTPNYGDMTEGLATRVREQSATITPLIQGFGSVQSMAHVGVENGAELFMVGFERQITQWIIAQDDEGKIVALLFRPASASTPTSTGG